MVSLRSLFFLLSCLRTGRCLTASLSLSVAAAIALYQANSLLSSVPSLQVAPRRNSGRAYEKTVKTAPRCRHVNFHYFLRLWRVPSILRTHKYAQAVPIPYFWLSAALKFAQAILYLYYCSYVASRRPALIRA